MNARFCLIVLVCAATWARLGIVSSGDTMTTAPDSALTRLASMNDDERQRLLSDLSTERSETEEVLVQQLYSRSKEGKVAAAYLLGLYRMKNSVTHLAKFIDIEVQHTDRQYRERLWDQYPVVEALIRIGKPSVWPMIENIERTDSQGVRVLSAKVVKYVEGPEIAVFIVQNAIDKQTDARKGAALLEALEDIKK